MKKLLLTAVVLFGTVAPVLAQEGDLHGDIGYTYDSMYVWRGILVYGHHSASRPFVDLDLFGSGFGISAIGSIANGTGHNPDQLGYNNEQRWDYSLFYAGAYEPQETYATMYKVGYTYFNYPQMSAVHSDQCIDLQEIFAGVAFPKLLGVKGLVPGYVVVKGWPSKHDTVVGGSNPRGGTYSGWAHIFMLDYALPIAGLTAETPEQVLNFHIETVYNAGVDPRPYGGYTSHDWTHVLMGVSTDFDLGNNLIFTPGLWHQITMEDDPDTGVSPDHSMTWAELTIKYKF